MPEENRLNHIKIEGYVQANDYVSPKKPGPRAVQNRNRAEHGRRIKQQLNLIKDEFEALRDIELPEGIIRDDAIYVEFISDLDFTLAFDSLHQDSANPKFVLLSLKREVIGEHVNYRVNVMLTEGGISHFINKVNEYLLRNTRSGKPSNQPLINNIDIIQLATLKAFWNEPSQVPFPDGENQVWWEVWFRRKEGVDQNQEWVKISNQLSAVGAELGLSEIVFPEHTIRLVRATAEELSNSLFLLDNLAELRKPKETADFFVNLSTQWGDLAVDDLLNRVQNETDGNSVSICILDSGVQNMHPLLSEFLRENSLHSYKGHNWGTHDGWQPYGHGTGMAGLALYGDMADALSHPHNISVFHQLESVKIVNRDDPNSPELYAAVMEEATSIPIVAAPQRPRVYCMAVTDRDQSFFGRPSSWSASLDKITFGSEQNGLEKQLFLVAGGNIWIDSPDEYPTKNHTEGVHDPGQSFNAITVGGYTDMDRFNHAEYPDSTILAPKGGMSPSNSTSLLWENQWPIKPDIVMEGGNSLNQNGEVVKPSSLQLLSTSKQYRINPFQSFGDTSGAVALASRMAAVLKTQYPNFWAETIRALIIHSATWTPNMLNGNTLQELGAWNKLSKLNLLKTYGFGVPDLERALYSASNSLTLIAEEVISPFKRDSFNEIHYFELPWPREVLQNELANLAVKLNITLSYFIEPNPGNRIYGSKFNYQSHSLRFSVIKPDEDFDIFQKRMNKLSRVEEDRVGYSGEKWVLGEQLHTKGSVHRDFWIGSGADLATRNIIAVRPGTGWYRTRKRLNKFDDLVRYSLIVSIETEEENIDIYTPVLNQIPVEINN